MSSMPVDGYVAIVVINGKLDWICANEDAEECAEALSDWCAEHPEVQASWVQAVTSFVQHDI